MSTTHTKKYIILLIWICSTTSLADFQLPIFESAWCKNLKVKIPPMQNVQDELVLPMNNFALQLWKKASIKGPNPVFSPWSTYTTLAMVLAGAKGVTENEIANALALKNPPKKDWHLLFRGMAMQLQCPDQYDTTEFNSANGLFIQKSKKIN